MPNTEYAYALQDFSKHTYGRKISKEICEIIEKENAKL